MLRDILSLPFSVVDSHWRKVLYRGLTRFFTPPFILKRVPFIYPLTISCMYIMYLDNIHLQVTPDFPQHISSHPCDLDLSLSLSFKMTEASCLLQCWFCPVCVTTTAVSSGVEQPCYSRRHFTALLPHAALTVYKEDCMRVQDYFIIYFRAVMLWCSGCVWTPWGHSVFLPHSSVYVGHRCPPVCLGCVWVLIQVFSSVRNFYSFVLTELAPWMRWNIVQEPARRQFSR